MKKTTTMSLLAVIMFFMAFPAQVCAKKIKFGQYVVYSGKVENGMPKGEGELTIVNNDPNCKKGALFKGVFDGYTISGELDLKEKGYYPSFSGSAKLEIAADGSYVRVNIISGSLTASIKKGGIATIRLCKKDSVSIVCTPTEQGIIFSSSNTFEAERKHTNTQETKLKPYRNPYNNHVLRGVLGHEFIYKLCIYESSEQIPQEIKRYGHSTYMLNKSGHLVQKEYYESIKLPKLDATHNLYENGVQQIDFGNGDFLRYKSENDITGFSVKMRYKEMNGKLCLKNHDDVMKFIKDDGEEYNAVSYDLSYFGSYTDIAKEIVRRRMINAVSDIKLELGRFILYKDTVADLVKNAPSDNQSAYDLGIALIEGVGVYKDEEIGESLISDAALHGNADAKAYMTRKRFIRYFE